MTPPASPASRVAIVIRTKDRTNLLARAIDDILEQTFEGWCAVIVNDGGEPQPVDELILARESRLRGRLSVVHNPRSVGMEAASNIGVRSSSGDLVAIHDDDDTWSPLFLEQTVAWLDSHSGDVAVAVATEIVIEHVDGDEVSVASHQLIPPPHSRLSLFDLILANRIPPIGMLLRREALTALGGFDESLLVLGDWDIALRLALAGCIGYADGETLAYWRQRPKSEGAASNSVFGKAALHLQTDREIRDRALRDYAKRNGIGGLLYLSRYIDERFAESRALTEAALAAQTAQLESIIYEHVRYHSPGATLGRAVRRLIPPLRRASPDQPTG